MLDMFQEAMPEIISGLVLMFVGWFASWLFHNARNKFPSISDEVFLELCKLGDAKKVEKAIQNGANVDAMDNDGNTALMWSIAYEYTDTIELLLEHGANVNVENKYE